MKKWIEPFSDHNPSGVPTGHLQTEEMLIDQMTRPSEAVREAVAALDGPILLLGVGGKMGPSLAELFVRAGAKQVIGVSRFTDNESRAYLDSIRVRTIQADLMVPSALKLLPDAPYIYFLAGFKFGATGAESATWTMNSFLPGLVMERYANSRVVYVSSGNVYAYVSPNSGGASESGEIGPVGEYAQSRLGGERIAQYLSSVNRTPLVIARLFYATELRYGILHDLAWKIRRGEPIVLNMGHVNQIWQGDANAYLTRLMPSCSSPATTFNMTGPAVLSVRSLAERLGALMGIEPILSGTESPTALLGNAANLISHLGEPEVSIDQMLAWIAYWVAQDGRSLGKPTKFESRTGKF